MSETTNIFFEIITVSIVDNTLITIAFVTSLLYQQSKKVLEGIKVNARSTVTNAAQAMRRASELSYCSHTPLIAPRVRARLILVLLSSKISH